MPAPPKPETPLPSFRGFTPDLFAFFDELAAHQTRDWFAAHKTRYETAVRRPLASFVQALSFAFGVHDIPLQGRPETSLFRINRDIRFSKDKRPYKTNAGAVLTRDGTKQSKGLFYIHLGHDHDGGAAHGGFMALGLYGPEPADLQAIRSLIVADPARWAEVEAALAGRGLALSDGEPLARPPRGFEAHAEAPFVGVLKKRHLTVIRPLAEAEALRPDLVDTAVDFAQGGLPLLSFVWSALERR